MLTPLFTLWLDADQATLSMICRLFRSTNVGVFVSGPMASMPDTEMFAKRVPGTKNRAGSNDRFSMLSVASYARFQATFATFSRFERMIHLCSPTNDCDFVRVSIVQNGIRVS
jgi:hypothetical protein